ncbi:MAG TPA: AMP-binding protein [Acidimicrobiales bacterium]|nr:AMP-binding protein [Acidimicrobiales bacterium]
MNLASIADGHPDDDVAIVSRGRPTTFGELGRQVAALRGGLVSLGVQPGDRVAIACANNRYFVVSYLAILGVGAVAVPLNPTSPTPEVERELDMIDARLVIAGPSGVASIEPIDRPKVLPDELDRLLSSDPAPMVERAADDLAVLIFTAGTAGSPKAAMLSHGNLHSNIRQIQATPERALHPDDVSYGVLPMFHIFGLNVVLGVSLYAGARVVLAERFDPVSALDSLRDHGVTILAGAPPMWQAWASMTKAPADAFRTVRIAASGASRLPPETWGAMLHRFDVHIAEGYGLTEASPTVTSSVGSSIVDGSIGRPIPGVEIRLVDADGEDAFLGDPGEIWVRGPNVFKGYWNDEDATAAALTSDGWLRTGDIAVADDKGNLTIVDRAKDLIIVSGFNVFPAEVEEVLLLHPAVRAAAVVGVEHPHSGEAVKAYVVVEGDQQVDEETLIEFCARHLARYKCPSKVLFIDDLPQGMGGKVLRRTLRWLDS